jgi:2-keto-4-pentenoate hydratase/2-oxohepta-3-ene-1,7-dioic acid hydratase in catechol pathway
MKLIGVRIPGTDDTRIAVTEGDDKLRVLTTLHDFWADPARWLENESAAGQLLSTKEVQVVPPVLPDARVICIGLNYRAHAAEGSYKDQELPPHPTLFARWTQSLSVDGQPAPVPANEAGLDWEGEIAAYIGRPLVDADAETARQAVLGYSSPPTRSGTSATACACKPGSTAPQSRTATPRT